MSLGTKFIYENYVVQKDTLTGEPEGLSFTQIVEAARAMPRKQRRRQLDEQRPSMADVGAAMGRSGRYLFKRQETPGLTQAQQKYSGAGSALRKAAGDQESLSKLTPTQRAAAQQALEPFRTKPGPDGKVTDASQIGTTPTAATVAKGMQQGVGAIDYDEVSKIRDRLRASASDPAKLDAVGLTGSRELDAAIEMAGHQRRQAAGTLSPEEALRGREVAGQAGRTAGREAYMAYLDPEAYKGYRGSQAQQRFGFDPESPGPSLAGIGSKQRERLKGAGVSDADIAQYERDMFTTVQKPIIDALGSATRDQAARTAQTAADMRTLRKAGSPYIKYGPR